MNYFITGTDTGVGKTLISCALLHGFAARGKSVVGMKPVAAGCDERGQHEDVRQLRAASNILASGGQINPYCLAQPVAPLLAARFAGIRINFARIEESFSELNAQAEVVIVEGAGGFCVPLNDEQDSADLAQQLGLPVVLVVGMRLGDCRGRPDAGWLGGEHAGCGYGDAAGKYRRVAPAHSCAPAGHRAASGTSGCARGRLVPESGIAGAGGSA